MHCYCMRLHQLKGIRLSPLNEPIVHVRPIHQPGEFSFHRPFGRAKADG